MLKIYPTLVVKGTGLYDQWVGGSYDPMSVEQGVGLLADMKAAVPPWVRILRIQRDIPAPLIEAGIRKGHLRELVARRMEEDGRSCRCIRCREVGHRGRDWIGEGDEPEMKRESYAASSGEETFLSYELPADNTLIGYSRLRVLEDGQHAVVRELHVYGQMMPLDQKPCSHWQHRGFGERLLSECERLVSEKGIPELLVTSGVGARGYYRSLGYERKGHYMAKRLVRA
jgi:elongator complex protein 3